MLILKHSNSETTVTSTNCFSGRSLFSITKADSFQIYCNINMLGFVNVENQAGY